jgi:hypothetical protein
MAVSAADPAARVTKRRFTVDEYHQMIAAGFFTNDPRVELVEGEVVCMPPMSRRHSEASTRALYAFFARYAAKMIVFHEQPVALSPASEPSPDLALIDPAWRQTTEGHPRAELVLLAFEISRSSLDYDLGEKADAYAAAGVRECWVLDVDGGALHVLRGPAEAGYAGRQVLRAGDSVAPLACPEIPVPVAELLP